MPYDDGAYTLFLYTDGDPGTVPESVAQFLRFMKDTSREKAVNDSLLRLHEIIEELKQKKEVQKAVMKWNELICYEREEASREERIRADEEKARADEEKARADMERTRADKEKARADRLEAELNRLLAGSN